MTIDQWLAKSSMRIKTPFTRTSIGPDRRKWIDTELDRLDPEADTAEMMRLLLGRILPAVGRRPVLNLFYCLGFMRIAGQREGAMAVDRNHSGKIHRAADRRADDTVAYFLHWFHHGPSSTVGAESVARIKGIHDSFSRRYSMSNETFLHTIALFTVQFEQLFDLVGAPGFTAREKHAQLAHWRAVGSRLGVSDLPQTWDGMVEIVFWYENSPQWFARTEAGERCAAALIHQFGKRWMPPGLRWAARPILLSLHDEQTLKAIGHESPPRPVVSTVRTAVRFLLILRRRVLPDPRPPIRLTAQSAPSSPR